MKTKLSPSLANEIDDLATRAREANILSPALVRQIRHAVGFLANEWEGITASGILVKDTLGVHPPASLGVPFTLKVLVKAFPELEIK